MNILLLGAGFSRNWGGWLASELNGDLLGQIKADRELRKLLQDTHSFESVLAQVQTERHQSPTHEERYQNFRSAIVASFYRMNLSYADNDFRFNFSGEFAIDVSRFLAKFDAIFTLNQDLLLELHYRPPADCGVQNYYPGLHQHIDPAAIPLDIDRRQRLKQLSEPLPESQFTLAAGQPIFKLHGSVDWIDAGKDMLIMGDHKPDAIQERPLLRWYYEEFRKTLNSDDAKIMTIGYSFQDIHINDLLWTAAEHHNMSMFLVDPEGTKVFDKTENSANIKNRWTSRDIPLIGISQRPLSTTFSTDKLEHGKLMRFF